MRSSSLCRRLLLLALILGLAPGCQGDKPIFDTTLYPVVTTLNYFKDEVGRYVHFKGINLGGNIKVPVVYGTQTDETPETYYGHVGDQIAAQKAGIRRPFTYVGRPFSLKKADAYFKQMKALGLGGGVPGQEVPTGHRVP